jgi:hypothetical protein
MEAMPSRLSLRSLLSLLLLTLAACQGGEGDGDNIGDGKPGGDSYEFEYCSDGVILTAICEGGICDPAPFVECLEGPLQCAEDEASCGYHASTWCENNEIVTEYCPSQDTVCWDHDAYEECDDGSCRVGEPCPYEYDYCQDGVIMTALCSDGLCDPLPFEDCGDGTCVISDGETTCPQA